MKSYEQHLPFVETWHQQILHFICPSLFWKLVRSAVSTPNTCWARRDISLKGFRGRKNKVFCSTEKANSKAKPSLPMYVIFTLPMLHKYVHMTSKLVTINSDCKSKYKAQLPTVGQIQKWILSYYLEMTKL